MKRISFLLLITTLLFSVAFAENAWKEEDWVKLYRLFEHDDYSISYDGYYLSPSQEMKVCEYKTFPFSINDSTRLARYVNWEELNCQELNGEWKKDGNSYYYSDYQNDTLFGIFSFCQLRAYNRGVAANSPYRFIAVRDLYQLDKSDFGSVSWEQIEDIIARIASSFQVELGSPRRMRRCEDFLSEGYKNDEFFDVWRQRFFSELSEQEAKEIQSLELFIPAYYQGRRLYSGDSFSLPGESFIPDMYFNIAIDQFGNIIHVTCPIYTEWIEACDDVSPISIDSAITSFDEIYSDVFMPGVEKIVIREAAIEYVAISGDQTASKGFSLYPCWVLRTEFQAQNECLWEEYIGINAITGKQMF